MSKTTFAEKLLKANPCLGKLFGAISKRRIRILIVADGRLAFDKSAFGLQELICECLKPSATPWEELTIVTAHRNNDKLADIRNFRFDTIPSCEPHNVPFTREYYEQVWLFGDDRENDEDEKKKKHKNTLRDSELAVLTKFMQDGGGVFATGDHWDLGAAMCSRVPRVRRMRKWLFYGVPEPQRAPDRNDRTRIDTLREGLDAGFTSEDQSDNVPQEIRPRFRMAEGRKGTSEPHSLLSCGARAISILPDHMHEGECVVPAGKELEETFSFCGAAPAFEFPLLPKSEKRLAPEVVAIATTSGGDLHEPIFELVEPRCFDIIVAYDGAYVGVGRVAVDSSFHHFVNINLRGDDASHIKKKFGFHDAEGHPTAEYTVIKRYYRNLAIWLCPQDVRTEYYVNMLAGLRYLPPLDEEIRPVPKPPLEKIRSAGEVTRAAITQRFSRVDATQCALAISALLPRNLKAAIEMIIDPWYPSELRPAAPILDLLDGETLLDMVLGSAMLGVAKILPDDPCDVPVAIALGQELAQFLATLGEFR